MWTERRSGLTNQRGVEDHRDPYERDRTRVIHCPSFRRLQRKTQILGTDEGDFHRTRLTHSLEVDSIGRSIVRNFLTHAQNNPQIISLLPNDDLVSVICLLHDIGHPPFGHGGEVALNYMMRDYGGFEGNGQTLRLLTKVENSYGIYGLDLTRRALLGILKYPVARSKLVAPQKAKIHESIHKTIKINDWLPPKAYFDCEQPVVDWLLAPFSSEEAALFQSLSKQPQGTTAGVSTYHNFDCSIMDVADDIAYGVHDLEDAIHFRLMHPDHLNTNLFKELLKATSLAKNGNSLINSLFSQEVFLRKKSIGELVNYFITSTQVITTHPDFTTALFKYNVTLIPEALALLTYLKQCIFDNVIDSQEARTFEYGGQTVVLRLFDAISSNPGSLLDHKNRLLFKEAQDETQAQRVVCDYIANMTDEYAYRMHERLFGFNTRTIFERL